MTCGIYSLVSSVTGKVYIGSSIEIEKRYAKHTQQLNNHSHQNYKMLKERKTLGAVFKLCIIEVCPVEELEDKELGYILYLDTVDCGLNISYDTTRKK